ncbi:serine/threonine-protein phosphatase 2A regulatory subunit B'' subunit beta [Ixodes scapularis]|uniref:serine/threonine-protein phosphatase 2A regulatory subunit B'' subunit beta n=1 Tax=Ixodes scapularis TaxID=6945 RepID=UPI001AD79893|nr:serine/threonine-protein phosphatase 2A regulatory subunit B'' subunit beta [Ixodes scapularis]
MPNFNAAPPTLEVELRRLRCFHRTPFCMASILNDGAGGADAVATPQDRTGDTDDETVKAVPAPSWSLLSAETDSDLVANVSAELSNFSRRTLTRHDFKTIVKICGLPLYLKFPLFQMVSKSPTKQAVLDVCRKLHRVAGKDRLSKVVFVLTKGRRTCLQPGDFRDMIQDLIETHSGLIFLRPVTRSHTVYIDTVVSRLFYEIGKTWTWRLGMAELRRSDFLSQLDSLECHNDFMNVEGVFSYKDAYVIHAIFNALDLDNDRLLNRLDLARYEKGALTPKVIERVFALLSTSAMTYVDFVVFLLAEKDKSHPRSIEYWFNRLDLDGDGMLTMYELEAFFREQYDRVAILMNDPVSFEDVYRQMIDLVKPRSLNLFALSDLKRCALASVFFNTFINTYEFIHHEIFDPFDADRLRNGSTQWEHFAKTKFSLLMEEEDREGSSEDELS